MGTSQLNWIWTDGSSSTYVNNSISGTTWIGSPSDIFGVIGDGTMSLTINAYDALGNLRTNTGYSWSINTTLPLATISLTGASYGNYLPADGTTVNLHPPTGSWLEAWMNWTFEQDNTIKYNGNDTSTISTTLTGLSNSPLWINMTVGDAYGRTNTQSWQYQIDGIVNTLPDLTLTGTVIVVSDINVVSPTTVISISNLTDDTNGVGYSSVECRNGSVSWTTVSAFTFNIPSLVDSEISYSIECRILDLLGNVGNSRWSNGTVDSLSPTVVVDIYSDVLEPALLADGDFITDLGTLSIICFDSFTVVPHLLTVTSNTYGTSTNYSLNSENTFSIGNLNLIEDSYNFQISCLDSLNNIGNININNLIFLSQAPGTNIQFSGESYSVIINSTIYVSNEATVVYQLSSNGHNNISIIYTIESINGYAATYYSNASTSVSLSNLSDGVYYLNVSTCSINLCSNSNKTITIDTTAPEIISSWISGEGTVIPIGDVILVGYDTSLRPQPIFDSGSPIDKINCNINNGTLGYFSISIDPSNWWKPVIWNSSLHGFEVLVSCQIIDYVNNTSPYFNMNMSFDFIKPEIETTFSSGYIIADQYLEFTCSDDSDIQTIILLSTDSLSVEYVTQNDFNGLYSQILSYISNGDSFEFKIKCVDNYGNSNATISYSGTYVSSLNETSYTLLSSFDDSNLTYFGNSSGIFVSPAFNIGNISILATSTNNITWSTNIDFGINDEVISNIFNNFSSILADIQLTHYLPNSSISHTLNLGLVKWVNYSVQVLNIDQLYLANGSSTHVSLSDTICNSVIVEYFIQDYTSIISTISGFDFIMPNGNNSDETLLINTSDCLGNTHFESWELTRDSNLPVFNFTGHFNNKVSNYTELSILTNDDSGIISRTISLTYGDITLYDCVNYTSECQIIPGDLFNLVNANTIDFYVSFVTYSGQEVTYESSLLIDTEVESWNISQNNSIYVFGNNISNNSIVNFVFEEHLDSFCISHSESSIEQGCWADLQYFNWIPNGEILVTNLTVYLSLTDDLGNTYNEFIYFNYYNILPTLTSTSYFIPNPGWINFEISHNFPTSMIISNSNNSQTSQNTSANFLYPGVYYENITFIDIIGNIIMYQNVRIAIDTTSPEINVVLSESMFIGRQTWLNITSQDNESFINTMSIKISSSQVNCSFIINVGNLSNYIYSSQLSTLLSSPQCALQDNNNYPISITIILINNVNRTTIHNDNIQFLGKIVIDYIDITGQFLDYEMNSSSAAVSNYTRLGCVADHLIMYNSSIDVIFGNYSEINDNLIVWNYGDGLIKCIISDSLGNTAERWFNLTFNLNDIVIYHTVTNGYQNISKSNLINFVINSSSQFKIIDIQVFTNSSLIYETSNNSFGYTMDEGYGVKNMRIMAHNQLGYYMNYSFQIIIDNSLPTLEVLNGSFYIFDDDQDTLLTIFGNIILGLEAQDMHCYDPPTISSSQNIQINQNNFDFYLSLPSQISILDIAVTDCVGWQMFFSFTIMRYSIPDPIVEINGSLPLNSTYFISPMSTNFSLNVLYPSNLNLQAECAIDDVDIACQSDGLYSWLGSYNNITSYSELHISFYDVIGNSKDLYIILEKDITSPICEFSSATAIDGTTYLLNLNDSEIQCYDSQTHIDSLWINSTVINYYVANLSRFSFDLSSSNLWSITSYDLAGNKYNQTFNLVEDSYSPNINCKPNRLNYHSLIIYSPGDESITCTIDDFTPISYNFTLSVNDSSILSGEGAGSTFNFLIPNLNSETNLLLTLSASDYFDNQDSTIYYLFIDNQLPEINLTSYSSNLLSMPIDIIDYYGKLDIRIIDYSLSYYNVTYTCGNTSFHTSFEIPESSLVPSDYFNSSCLDSYSLNIEVFDRAGNFISQNFIFSVDIDEPVSSIDSTCYIEPSSNFHVMVDNCILQISILDDSQVNSFISFNSIDIEFSGHYYELDISQYLDSYINTSFNIVTFDSSGKFTNLQKIFRKSNDAILDFSYDTCVSIGINCEGNSIIVGSNHQDIEIHNPIIYNQVPIIQSSLQCRSPSSCSAISLNSSLTFNSSILEEGFHTLDISELDILGRLTIFTIDVWIDIVSAAIFLPSSIDSSTIIPVINNTYPGEDSLPICQTCKLEFYITEASEFSLSGNFFNHTISKFNQATFKVSIPLNIENLDLNYMNELSIYVISQSGQSNSLIVPLSPLIIEDFIISTSIARCTDNYQFADSLGKNNLICIYDPNDNSPSKAAIEFNLKSNYPIQYQISYSQNFTSLLSDYGNMPTFMANTKSYFDLPILFDNPFDSLMIYSLEYQLGSELTSSNINIIFLRSDGAKPSLFSSNENYVIYEDGFSEVSFDIIVNASLPSGLNYSKSSLIEELIYDIRQSNCSWTFEFTLVPSGDKQYSQYESYCDPEIFTNGDKLTFSLPENILSDLSINSGHPRLPLFQISRSELQISFVFSSINQNYSFNFKDPEIIISPQSDILYSSNCEDYDDKKSQFFATSIDWLNLQKCLSQSYSEDYVTHVGIKISWLEFLASEDKETIILCPKEQIPSNFEEWWDLELNQCKNFGKIPDKNRNFLSLKFETIGCTLRCNLEVYENIQPFSSNKQSISLENGIILNPNIDDTLFQYSIYGIGILIIFFIVNGLRASKGKMSSGKSKNNNNNSSLPLPPPPPNISKGDNDSNDVPSKDEFSNFFDIVSELLGNAPQTFIDEFVVTDDFKLFEKVSNNPISSTNEDRTNFFIMINKVLGDLPSDSISTFVNSPDYKIYTRISELYGA